MEQNLNQPNVQLILSGDSQEFSKLVDDYKNLVFTVALRMLKNPEEAEEVAQDTFIKVFKSIKNFKGDSKFSTWIYRITYNTCLDRLKKIKKEQNISSFDEISGLEIANLNTVLDDIERGEKSKLLKKCMELLSPNDSALLSFFYFEEKNLKELSKILSLSENTVKVRLFRARERLGSILKERLNPETIRNYG
ncbi:RNA polymerase sigma factor [Croceitalea sp. MTPC9]|uniref:RNA polymerase sigma factor n=1 Tax=unclassified Croceitalea TaxID=2632280 RepID=UPI002B3E1AC1|nr:RNA polymerase sigma factor [Croceitalea sp. MTPC6]GMN17903.1 RNA polymerase sigma factor [Croceitalea sp. MTPC9]